MTRVGSGLTTPGSALWRHKVPFSVLIADGDDDFRELVRSHLGGAVVVVGDVGDADDAVCLAKQLRPDVVLMDIAMPLLGGPEAARRIKADRAETKIVFLASGHGEGETRGHADALLRRDKVRRGLLSQIGRIARTARKQAASARREGAGAHPRRRRRGR